MLLRVSPVLVGYAGRPLQKRRLFPLKSLPPRALPLASPPPSWQRMSGVIGSFRGECGRHAGHQAFLSFAGLLAACFWCALLETPLRALAPWLLFQPPIPRGRRNG